MLSEKRGTFITGKIMEPHPTRQIIRQEDRKGWFIVVDGLDGVGKGVVERAIIDYEQKLGRAVFDSVAFSRAHRKGLPELEDFWNPPEIYYDTVVTAEPGYAGIGKVIRDEIISDNGRDYSSSAQVAVFSLDRLVQMKKVVIPAIRHGLNVLQSRFWISTLHYQMLEAEKEGLDKVGVENEIMENEATKLQLLYSPDLLIIPTVKDAKEAVKRIESRKDIQKDDKSIFDNIWMQKRLKEMYEDPRLARLLANYGTKVVYIDAGITRDETARQSVQAYKNFMADPLAFVRERNAKFS